MLTHDKGKSRRSPAYMIRSAILRSHAIVVPTMLALYLVGLVEGQQFFRPFDYIILGVFATVLAAGGIVWEDRAMARKAERDRPRN